MSRTSEPNYPAYHCVLVIFVEKEAKLYPSRLEAFQDAGFSFSLTATYSIEHANARDTA